MEKLAYDLFWAGLISTGVSSLGYLLNVLGARLVPYRLAATDIGVSVPVPTGGNGPADLAEAGSRPWAVMGSTFAWLAVAFLTGALAARWVAAARPPLSNMWEYTVAFGWGVSLFYAVSALRFRQSTLGAVMMPVALVLLATAALFFPPQVKPLVPALQANQVLAAHVGTMMLSYSVMTVSFAAAVLYLVQGERRRFVRLPDAETLEELGYRSVLVGFPLMALGIALGAYWASSAWGRYWGWDPKETSALVTWLIYAGYLHARGMRGWRGRRSALMLIGGFVGILFSYFAVNLWISGLHSYAGV